MPKRVADILKVRWSEAVMLVGLFAGLSALGARMTQEFYTAGDLVAQLPFWSAFLMGMSLMILMILLGTLFLGFLRSVIIEPPTPRQPIELLRLGRPYFWKLFLFYILFELLWTILAALLMGLLYGLIYGQKPTGPIPDWLLRFCQIVGLAVLIKPFLLMPSIILLKDNTIREAFYEFRSVSLFAMQPLIRSIWIGFGLVLAVYAGLYLIPLPQSYYWIRVGILGIAAGGVFLCLFLTALLEIQDSIRIDSTDDL